MIPREKPRLGHRPRMTPDRRAQSGGPDIGRISAVSEAKDAAAILKTQRLRLREFAAEDLDVLATMVADQEQMRFYPRRRTRDEALAWIGRNLRLYEEYGFGFWLIESRPTSMFLGYCGIRPLAIEGTGGDGDRLAYNEDGLEPRNRHRGCGRRPRSCIHALLAAAADGAHSTGQPRIASSGGQDRDVRARNDRRRRRSVRHLRDRASTLSSRAARASSPPRNLMLSQSAEVPIPAFSPFRVLPSCISPSRR